MKKIEKFLTSYYIQTVFILFSIILVYTYFLKNLIVGKVYCFLHVIMPKKLYKCNLRRPISHCLSVLIIQESCNSRNSMFFRDAG